MESDELHNRWVIAASAPLLAALISILLLLLWTSQRGFDITDDSFYALNIFFPERNIGAVSEFGKYINIFSSENISKVRNFGLFSIVSASFLYAYFMSYIISKENTYRYLISISLIFSSFSIYRYWLITPSYNTFVLLGALMLGVCVLRSSYPAKGKMSEFSLGTLVALGGFLVAIGRPTSALAIGGAAGIWIASIAPLSRTIRIGSVAICVFVLLALLHITLLAGGFEPFFARISFAKQLAEALEAGHTFASALERLFDGFLAIPTQLHSVPFVAGVVATLAAYFARASLNDREKRSAQSSVAGIAALVATTVYYVEPAQASIALGYLGVRLCLLLLAQLGFFILCSRRDGLQFEIPKIADGNLSPLVAALALASLAFVSPFGGTGEIIRTSGTEYPLYGAAALVLLFVIVPARFFLLRGLAINLIALPVLLVTVYVSLHPYRLPESIYRQTERIGLLGRDSPILADAPTASWANRLSAGALEHGWSPGLPLIDLTGGTPGAALLLGANAPVTPWIVGGYKGSHAYAAMILAAADKQALRSAWILTAPEGDLRIDENVLKEAGLDFPAGYSMVVEARTGHRNERQLLWKPLPAND